jgi:hypothetical protein
MELKLDISHKIDKQHLLFGNGKILLVNLWVKEETIF